jgi:hypothetical protein
MTDERFPLGKPLNRREPARRAPERVNLKRGIFSVDGKLQTELPLPGPQFAPVPTPAPVQSDDAVEFWYARRIDL